MHEVSRTGTKYGGTYIVYDNREDALANGVLPEDIGNRQTFRRKSFKLDRSHGVVVSKYVEFDDGPVMPVLNVSIGKVAAMLTTPTGCYATTCKGLLSDKKLGNRKNPKQSYAKPDSITPNRYKFVHEWLFGGFAIEEAVARNLSREFLSYNSSLFNSYLHAKEDILHRKRFQLTMFAYWVLTQEWFDKLLIENRLVRDKYVGLLNAFEKQGIDDAYIAKYVRAKLDSQDKADTKERINAFNKAVDIMMAAEQRQRGKELPSNLAQMVEDSEQRAIPQSTQPALPESFDELLEEEEQHASQETTPETQDGPEVNRERDSRSEHVPTNGHEAVPTVETN